MFVIADHFNLLHTLESGQLFRYSVMENKNKFTVRHKQWAFVVEQRKNTLSFKDIPRKELVRFFNLDENYLSVINHLRKHALLAPLISQYYGLRIMHQDPWECMLGFLCSSASNIPKIKKNLALLEKSHAGFPEPGGIKSMTHLKQAALGFRAKYLWQVNKKVTQEFLDRLHELSYAEAQQQLMGLPGIGPKIADCILLFAYNKQEAFPIDIWMQRVMQEFYFNNKKTSHKTIHAFAQQHFHPYAGYAQQYLYHWRRNVKTL